MTRKRLAVLLGFIMLFALATAGLAVDTQNDGAEQLVSDAVTIPTVLEEQAQEDEQLEEDIQLEEDEQLEENIQLEEDIQPEEDEPEEEDEQPEEDEPEEEDEPAAEREVVVERLMKDILRAGSYFTMRATPIGFEGVEPIVQWQYNAGNGWTDVEGGNSLTLRVAANERNVKYQWRVLLTAE